MGCAPGVGWVDREVAPGPVRIDPDRPIEVKVFDTIDSLAVTLPLLFYSTDSTFVGPCTVRAVRIDDDLWNELEDSDEDVFGPGLLGAYTELSVGDTVRAFDPVGPDVIRATRRVTPELAIARDEMGELTGGLYVEARLTNTRGEAERCGPLTGPVPQSVTGYLIGVNSVRQLEGSAAAAGFFLVAIVGITQLFGR